MRNSRWGPVAPKRTATGPHRQYHRPRKAIPSGPQAFKYSGEGGLVLGWWDVAEGFMQAFLVVRGHPLRGCQLDVGDAAPGLTAVDHLALVSGVDRLKVDGRCGFQCRKRPGGIVQRRPQTRDPARPVLLAGGGELPPRGVPVAGPLQHQTTALPMPPFQPRKLRKDPHDRYAARSRLTTNPVSTTWGQGPTSPLRSVHLSQPRSASGYSPMQLINQIPLNQEWTN